MVGAGNSSHALGKKKNESCWLKKFPCMKAYNVNTMKQSERTRKVQPEALLSEMMINDCHEYTIIGSWW